MAYIIINLFSAFSFICYGTSCLFSRHMKLEFDRFGLRNQRKLTGILQLLGGAGLLIGGKWPTVGLGASLGLGVLMLLGTGVRIKIQDQFKQMIPAVLFLLVNSWLTWSYAHLLELW